MRIISKTNKRKKKWMMAAIAGMLMIGIQQPVQAAVTQNDLAPPVSDASTHVYTRYIEDGCFEKYHQSTYKYVYFGMYPQTEVTGSKLTDAIRNASYDGNGDVTVNGKRYRRIQYSQTSIKSINPSDEFNEKSWVSDSTDGYRYFLYEPIRWRILSNNGSTLLLQTADAIDYQLFSGSTPREVTFWSNSDLRKWLNYTGGESNLDKYFYRNSNGFYYYAFSDEQKAKIQITHLVQDSYPYKDNGYSGGEDTYDKIFILNNTELRNTGYGFCNNKQCYVRGVRDTAYAQAVNGDGFKGGGDFCSNCWIRTPGETLLDTLTFSGKTGNINLDSRYNDTSPAVLMACNVSYKLSDCFKISFVTGTEQSIESQIMIASNVAKEPKEPVKEGYTFLGWYLDKDCKKPYDFTTNLTTDTTLYAGWKDPNSKEVVSPQEVEKAENITDFKTDDTSYKVDSKIDKTVIFEGFTGKNKEKEKLTIPSTIEYGGITYKVTSMDADAFKDCKNVTEVTVGKYITEIPAGTFTGCSSLTKVVIGKNVTVIKQGAFQNCKKLKTVTFEKGSQLTTIGSNVFYGCSKLTGIKLPSGATGIGSKAFYKCSALKSITIPSKVSIIEKQTFYGCSNMTKATIGKSVTAIKQGAFQNCKKLKTITVKTHSLSKSKVGKNAFKSIYKKATFKVPKKKYSTYVKIFKQKKIGYKSSMKIKKY